MNKPANPDPASTFGSAAYGGDNWSQRDAPHRDEIGKIWAPCGIDSEWRRLKSVLLHCPGEELLQSQEDADAVQMLGAQILPISSRCGASRCDQLSPP